MNSSPKARFLEQEQLAKQFFDITASESFLRASELAMLALIEELRDSETSGFHQIMGAQRFLEILKGLPEKSRPMPTRTSHTLNHDLK